MGEQIYFPSCSKSGWGGGELPTTPDADFGVLMMDPSVSQGYTTAAYDTGAFITDGFKDHQEHRPEGAAQTLLFQGASAGPSPLIICQTMPGGGLCPPEGALSPLPPQGVSAFPPIGPQPAPRRHELRGGLLQPAPARAARRTLFTYRLPRKCPAPSGRATLPPQSNGGGRDIAAGRNHVTRGPESSG